MLAEFNQKPKSPGRFVVMRPGWDISSQVELGTSTPPALLRQGLLALGPWTGVYVEAIKT